MSTAAERFFPAIRPLQRIDLERVMQIELAAYPFPWTLGIFEDCLRVGYACHGLEYSRRLVGYSVLSCAAGEAHLLNLCVDPDWHGQGFGRLLLDHTIDFAGARRCGRMYLEVRPSNQAGIRLYSERGFRVVGERPDYYRAAAGRENALVMACELGNKGPASA